MWDSTNAPDYKPPLPAPVRTGSAQVAQLVEHATENRSVGGSIPPLGTSKINVLAIISDLKKCTCPLCVRIDIVGHPAGCSRPVKSQRRTIHRVSISAYIRELTDLSPIHWREAAGARTSAPTGATPFECLHEATSWFDGADRSRI